MTERERTSQVERKAVALFGPNGAGKGELVKRYANQAPLVAKYGSGDGVRASEDANHPEFGKWKHLVDPHREASKKGKLIPDEVMDPMCHEAADNRLSNPETSIFLLDGALRKRSQVRKFRNFLAEKHPDVKLMGIELKASLKTSLARSANRVAEAIAAKQKPRDDDAPHVVEDRYRLYKEETELVVEELKEEGIVYTVNAERTAEAVGMEVDAIIFDRHDQYLEMKDKWKQRFRALMREDANSPIVLKRYGHVNIPKYTSSTETSNPLQTAK